jgi:hypothetical protein
MKITINHNGFHGYTSRAIVVSGKPGERVELTPSQIKKLARAACGCHDCSCGESLLKCCDPNYDTFENGPRFILIPTIGNEINVRGNYPQN